MPTDTTSIKVLRHAVRENLAQVFVLLEGQPGLSQEERVERFDKALAAVNEASKALIVARNVTAERDDEAHAAAKAAVNETFVEIIEGNLED